MAKKPTKAAEIPAVFERMQQQVLALLDVLHKRYGLEYALQSEALGLNKTTGRIKLSTRKIRKSGDAPYGAMALIYKPVLAEMSPDDFGRIPVGAFNAVTLMSAASARASTMWGTKSYSCALSKDRKWIEFWRFPDGIDHSLIAMQGNRRIPRVAEVTADDE